LEALRRSTSRAAYVAAALNAVGACTMLLLLQPGLPVEGSKLADRVAWVDAHHALWWAGWITWHAAAISLLGLYVGLSLLWRVHAPLLSRLALLVAAAGLASDLGAEAVYMGVMPGMGKEAFGVGEVYAAVMTGYLGNGLYAVAGVMLTIAGAREMPRTVSTLAWLVWADAAWLSAAALTHSAFGMFWSTAVLEPLFVGWTVLLAHSIRSTKTHEDTRRGEGG